MRLLTLIKGHLVEELLLENFERNPEKLAFLQNISHQYFRPSTSRERPSQLFGISSEYISATTNEKLLCNSKPLQRKKIAAKEKETVTCCKQKDVIIGSEEINNRSERQNQGTNKWLQSTPHLDDSESGKKQELESMGINISCYSGTKNQELDGTNESDLSTYAPDLSKEIKINAKNITFSTIEDNENLTETMTTVLANYETSSDMRTNKTGGNRPEFRIGILPGEKTADTPALSLVARKQFLDTSLRNKSSAADDCRSFFIVRVL